MTRRTRWIIAMSGVVLGFSLGRLWRARFRRGRLLTGQPGSSPRGPVTQAQVPVQPAEKALGQPGQNLDRRLDEALEETFPGSDPISLHIE